MATYHEGNVPEGGKFVTTLQNPADQTLWDVYETRNKNPAEFVTIKLIAQVPALYKGNYKMHFFFTEKRFSRTIDWLTLLRQRPELCAEVQAFCQLEWPVPS